MASFAGAARLMALLQIALFVVSAVIMSSSVCHAVGGIRVRPLDPNHPVCHGQCAPGGGPYRPQPYPHRPRPGRGAPPPYNGGIGRP
uniref:Uncharacterized protein n=1 Tax=Aegilops tauschii TaxID=37682 RepID=M8BBD6_AEGTA|nr:uncharacterized protein LOC120967863 [Aegilops tauschii subsp. strangulata]